jgi:MFS family permease
VVVGAGTANAVGPPMYMATTGLFVLPIVEETGFSRTTVTGAYSVAAVGMVIGLLITSRLVDRYAARYILVPAFVLYAASMATIGLVPPVEAVYFVPCFFVGFFGGGTAVPATRAVVSWFDNNRALAVGVVTGIIGLGAALGPERRRAAAPRAGLRPAGLLRPGHPGPDGGARDRRGPHRDAGPLRLPGSRRLRQARRARRARCRGGAERHRRD